MRYSLGESGVTEMTPAERAAAWRVARPTTQEPEAQQAIVQTWIKDPESCPYTLHRASFEVRSTRSGRKQQQLLVQGVRMSRAVVTYFLLHNEWCHPSDIEFAPRLHHIARRCSLE